MASLSPSRREGQGRLAVSAETDRQMVLIHIDNTLLAMRTSLRLHQSRGSSVDSDRDGSGYAAVEGLLDLQRRLFAGAVPVPSAVSPSPSVRLAPQSRATPRTDLSVVTPAPIAMIMARNDDRWERRKVSESTILTVFADVCRSPSTSAVVTGVALTALVDMLELPCAFISAAGLHAVMEAASETRAEVRDVAAHEVLLSRIFAVYAAALSHPAAVEVGGDVYVRVIGRIMILAIHRDISQLLKRTAEKCLRNIVMSLFRRFLYLPSDAETQQMVVGAGATVLHFISQLISGEVASFDNDGGAVASSEAFGGGRGAAGAPPSDGAGDDKRSQAERTITLIQLEGLALAQDCLLLLSCSLGTPMCAPVLDTVQNKLCRALLIAGVGTAHSIVLAQVLRTVHLVTQSSSEFLIPQMYNFVRVLHLNPLEALANELSEVSARPPGSPASLSGSPSPAPAPYSPASATSPNSGNFGRLPLQLVQRKRERRDILLDSLAEFCSDPRFGSFCFVHYDLSWRYVSLLPQICHILANHAYPVPTDESEEQAAAAATGAAWKLGRGRLTNSRGMAVHQRRQLSAGGYREDSWRVSPASAGQLLRSTQRTALDATMNMISGIALRAIATGSSAASSTAPPSPLSPLTSELHQLIHHAQQAKATLTQFASLFEDSPMKKGIPFLMEHAVRVPAGMEEEASLKHRTRLVLAEPAGGRELGEALYRLSIVLNKRVLGDYIGEQGRNKADLDVDGDDPQQPAPIFSVRFFVEQLEGFIHQFEFQSKPLLEAIREMVYLLCLPGESQKIDRVMEAFAKHWYQQNLTVTEDGTVVKDASINPFHSESGAFVLSFAIIMLNTDQHSGKLVQQMKKEDFIKMNRGIDEGHDVPAAYLGAVFEDVRQHEVVMADMMDRGFGNETTWMLEMRPCASFLPKAVRKWCQAEGVGPLTALPPHEFGQEETSAVETATTRAVMDDARQGTSSTLDYFLFQTLWKRSLLVFNGMLESSVEEVSSVTVAEGATVGLAVEAAHKQLPFEMSVVQASLRGVCMLARAAHMLQLPAVADQCFMGLLQFVMLGDLTDAAEEVRAFYRSVPRLLCMREVFSLFKDIYRSLGDSWLPFSRLVLDLHLMGLLIPRGQQAKAVVPKPQLSLAAPPQAAERAESGDSAAEAHHILLEDPGICGNLFTPLVMAAGASTEPKEPREKSWFSSLFGRSGAPQVPAAQLLQLQEAQGRIRDSLPDIYQLLSILQGAMSDAHTGSLCVRSFCAVSSIGPNVLTDVADGANGCTPVSSSKPHSNENKSTECLDDVSAYAASYELSLICAVLGSAAAAETVTTLEPQDLAHLTSRIGRLLRAVDSVLRDPRAGDAVRAYWCTLGRRVVCTSLGLMAVHWRGERFASALEQLWACWMHASSSVFSAVIAEPVVSFLDRAITSIMDSGKDLGEAPKAQAERYELLKQPWASGGELLVLLSPFVTHAPAITDVAVQRRVRYVLLRIVQQIGYSVEEDTETVVSLCLSFTAWQRRKVASAPEVASGDVTDGGVSKLGSVGVAGTQPSGVTEYSASLAEILSLCGRYVLMENASAALNGASTSNIDCWRQWVFTLRSLGALALCSAEARDGNEAILCLQRALLDSEAHHLPATTVSAVYKEILIPLTDRMCLPKARVQPELRWDGLGGATASSLDKADGAHSGHSARSLFSGIFNSLLAPAAGEPNECNGSVEAVVAAPERARRSASAAPFIATEVKCRLLSLVPKMLLRYTAALTAYPDVLLFLWKQVLGTIYAVYSAYPPPGASSESVGWGCSSQEESMLVHEAVEETVKNMIYVVTTIWHEPSCRTDPGQQQEVEFAKHFCAEVAQLLRPFPFSAALIDYMAHAGLLPLAPQEKTSAAAAAAGAVPEAGIV